MTLPALCAHSTSKGHRVTLQGTWELGGQCEPTGHDDACTVCTALHMSKVLCIGTGAWRAFGDHFETTWRTLGVQHLELTWRPLGGHLEATWRPLGGHLEAIWSHLEPKQAQDSPRSAPRAPKLNRRDAQEAPS